ncbi:MAG: M23 family metallopeptidase [Labilithrix sp.]|nr:M23 family metallopeptidase [Labilithrix sp.]MCW5836962.1 M23 family metallopeptidase [Labilithrix sp.]
METPRLRFGLSLVFASAIASSFGVAACSPVEAEDALALDADDSDGDLDPSFDAPDDDPNVGDDSVEPPEQAALEDDGSSTSNFVEEVDVTDIVEGASKPLAAKRVASPVPGRGVTYPYGVKNPRYAAGFHTGQDHAAPTGTAVVAVRSGKIRWSNNNGGAYGRWMGLDADNGRTYVYCHLSSRRYKAGTKVKAGQRIGRVGATGNVTGPHLHFEDHPKGPFRYAQVRKPKW